MENELRDLLAALDTQIDGVESYLKKINELGNDQQFHSRDPEDQIRDFGIVLRVSTEHSIELEISWLRKNLQEMRDAADNFNWSLIGE